MSKLETKIEKLLDLADVKIGGQRDWDLQVHKPELFRRVLAEGTLGLGEAYMEGWWDVPDLAEFISKVTGAKLHTKIYPYSLVLNYLESLLTNRQTKHKSKKVAEIHYNLNNQFYEKMLGPSMQYSCAYWKTATTLDEAQRDKLELICQKLQLKPGETLLDIGCGWGGLAKYAAQNYGCKVTGLNISTEQIKFAREHCAGLPVEIKEMDYRDMHGQFDKIVSVGAFEHFGAKNYRTYMKVASRCLKEKGLMLLHTIGSDRTSVFFDPWYDKYIFPGAHLPSVAQITQAADGIFTLEDYQNFGVYYDQTLLAWYENFQKHWPEFQDQFPPEFYRMWTYYLLISAGAFRSRYNQLFQFLFCKGGYPGVYIAPR
jgi:cyclopropane-fatty-acyl-phospholipid synthase